MTASFLQSHFELQPSGWLTILVPSEWEQRAQSIRQRRDEQYGNIFTEEESDRRWVGDLGEICFNYWLKERGVSGFQWHLDNAAGKPDFSIGTTRVDVKTVKRKVPPQPEYTAQITAIHRDRPLDELFFMSYEFPVKKLWLLGGIRMDDFIRKATFYGAGAQVHAQYIVCQGHEIYNGPIDQLVPPKQWLQQFHDQTT